MAHDHIMYSTSMALLIPPARTPEPRGDSRTDKHIENSRILPMVWIFANLVCTIICRAGQSLVGWLVK